MRLPPLISEHRGAGQRDVPAAARADGDISLPSTLQAYDDSPIFARTSGYLARWSARHRHPRAPGSTACGVQSPEVDQELNQARAMLSQIQANATLAEGHGQAIRGSDSHQRRCSAGSRHRQPESERAKGCVAGGGCERKAPPAELQSFERVVAPFDGVITQRLINEGDLINAGNGGSGAQLFRISKISTMRVFIPVPEVYGSQITTGLKAELTLTELPKDRFEGAVVRTSHSIDPGSHTLLTEIDVPNPTGKLLPGAYANVHLHLAQQSQELLVPTGCRALPGRRTPTGHCGFEESA